MIEFKIENQRYNLTLGVKYLKFYLFSIFFDDIIFN